MLYDRQPGYADAAALVALFVVPLLVLRIVIDRLIPRNVVFGVWADRIGGGLLGLVTAMVLTGMLMLAAQMLPFGPSILTYRSHGPSLQRNQQLWPFRPDEFTLWLVNGMSKTSLRSDQGVTFRDAHDDLLLELFCARNDGDLKGKVDSGPGAIKVMGAWMPSVEQVEQMRQSQAKQEGEEVEASRRGEEFRDPPKYPSLPRTEPGKLAIVRVVVNKNGRTDKDLWWRLPMTHFRLESESGHGYYPVAYLTAWSRSSQNTRDLESVGVSKAPWRFHVPGVDRDSDELNIAGLCVQREWTTMLDKSRTVAAKNTAEKIVAEAMAREKEEQGGGKRGRGRGRRRGGKKNRKARGQKAQPSATQAQEVEIDLVYSIRRRDKPVRMVFRRTSVAEIRSAKPEWPSRSTGRRALDRYVQR